MTELPTPLITEILSRLPIKSLVRFRCVSKVWLSLIDGPHLRNLHLKNSMKNTTNHKLILRDMQLYSVEFPTLKKATLLDHPYKCRSSPTEVVGCCNGLLCLSDLEAQDVVIYNPATKRHRELPASSIEFPRVKYGRETQCECERVVYGFGYDQVHDDYKVVRIVQFTPFVRGVYDSEVRVYSLNSNSWRRVEDFSREYFLVHKEGWGIYANGCLHWVVSVKPASGTIGSELIVAFDLGFEKCRVVPQPKYSGVGADVSVGVLRGCLTVFCSYSDRRTETWVMEEYGVEKSWSKLFTIAQSGIVGSFHYVWPIAYSKDGSKVLLEQDLHKLSWFDVRRNRVEHVKIRGLPEMFNCELLVESLVPIDNHIKRKKLETKRNETHEGAANRTKNRKNEKRGDLGGFLSKGFKLKL